MNSVFVRVKNIIVALLVFTGLAMPQLVAAQVSQQQANGYKISPVRRDDLTIEKGKSQQVELSLENLSDAATTARAVVNDFVASENESGEPRLILDDNAPLPKNDFKKLVDTIPDVTLGPKEKKQLNVKISVPENANAGGYYGAIRFVPASLASQKDKNVGLTASVGTIFLVRVPGNLKERVDLVQLSASNNDGKAKKFFTNGDVAIMTRLKNSGDIHVQPFGKIDVKDMLGNTVQTIEFNNAVPDGDGVNARANILPESTRKFVDKLNKRRWIGRYTVEANLGYSQGSGDIISAKATFWYVPTVVLLGLIVLILAIVGGTYWFIRRQKARKQHKHDVNKKKNY